jgi:predicted metal-binding membrane protein
MIPAELLTGLLRRDRALVLGGLAAVVALAWGYLLLGAGLDMGAADMGGAPMTKMVAMRPEWTEGYAALIFVMWAVMMAAMMLPSAAPTVLLMAALARGRGAKPGAAAPFAAGYVLVCCGFALAATLLQWRLAAVGRLSATMALASAAATGAALFAAGAYQWSPLKDRCLQHCRLPLGFLVGHWRPGAVGALRSGIGHGLYCLGCCWMLMALLFVGGLINLLWVALIAFLVLCEKTLPWGGRMSRATGALLMLWGAVSLARLI